MRYLPTFATLFADLGPPGASAAPSLLNTSNQFSVCGRVRIPSIVPLNEVHASETLQREPQARPRGLGQRPEIKRLTGRPLVGAATQPPILFVKQREGRVQVVGHDTAVDLVERRLAERA